MTLAGYVTCCRRTKKRLLWRRLALLLDRGLGAGVTTRVVALSRTMAFTATAVRVLIASPSDTAEARQALVEAINGWNDLNSESLGVVLIPTLWEISASPEMGDRPQALINRQIVDRCDILVGTFWTRLGTPTGVAVSGTVEEIEGFIARGAEALLYFSDQPAAPGNLDPDQLKRLAEYKADLQRRGLLGAYETVLDLTHKVQRDLRRAVERLVNAGTIAAKAAVTSASTTTTTTTTEMDRNAEYIASQLRKYAAQSEPGLNLVVAADDVDGVRRLMADLGFHLSTLLGAVSELRAGAAGSDAAVALATLAQKAGRLERFDVFLDGGKSWGELVSRAEQVLAEVHRLSELDWRATFSGDD